MQVAVIYFVSGYLKMVIRIVGPYYLLPRTDWYFVYAMRQRHLKYLYTLTGIVYP